MDSSTVSVDHSFWSGVSYSESQVGLYALIHITTCKHDVSFSYISEAAASLLDQRLSLHIVPRTQLVSLSSPVRAFHVIPQIMFPLPFHQAFFYDWLDRNASKKGKPLPEKIGSMQYFLHGYQGMFPFSSQVAP